MNDILFSLCYFVIFALCLYFSRELAERDVLSPGIIFPILLYFYSVASSLYANEVGTTNFGYPVGVDILFSFYASAVIGLIGFFAGRWISLQVPLWRVKENREPVVDSQFSNNAMFYAVLLVVATASYSFDSFNILSQHSYAERGLEMRVENMADAGSGLKSIVLTYIPVTLVVCASCLVLFDRTRSALLRFAAAIVIGLNLGANVLAGWRGSVMATLSIVVIYYHYRVRRFRLTVLLTGSVAIYALTSVMSIVRVTSDPVQMLNALRGEVNTNALAFLSLSKSGELLTGTNLMRQIGGIRDGELKYSFGSTIVDDLLVFIPRPLYPNRPLPSAEKFIDIFYPGVRETGGGYGFFILQEGHWAGGYVGIFLVMCLFGYVVYSVYWIFLAKRNSQWAIFAYALAFPSLCVFAVRSGVIGSFKSAMIHLTPLIVLFLLPPLKRYGLQVQTAVKGQASDKGADPGADLSGQA